MLRRVFLLAAALVAAACQHAAVQAADSSVNLPPDAKFVVRLDVAALQKSQVAGQVFEQVKAQVLEEMAKKDGGPTIEQIKEVVGFDPFEEVQSLVVAASDYESPEKSLVAAIKLRKTTGNLEGLMLALPGYGAERYGDHQIHSAKPEEDMEVFGAIHADGDGNRTLVVAAQRASVEKLLDSLDGKTASESEAKIASLGEGSPLLAVQVFELPPDIAEEEGPPANIAKIVSSIALQIAEVDGNVNVTTQVVSHDDQQAEQLKQMAQGLVAMVNLKVSSDPEDEKAKHLQRLLQGVAVERNAAKVEVKLSLPGDEVAKLIQEEIKKKHGQN